MPKGQIPKTRRLRKTTATINKVLKTPRQMLGTPASLKKHGGLRKIGQLLGRSMSKGKGK